MSTYLDELCDILSGKWEDCNIADGADMPILGIAVEEIRELKKKAIQLNNLLEIIREAGLLIEDIIKSTGGGLIVQNYRRLNEVPVMINNALANNGRNTDV